MKQTRTTLPLGIDLGSSRVRVALAERRDDGTPSLIAVATRPIGPDAGAALCDALDELQTTERRCVFGIAKPDAQLRIADFPAMRRAERDRAATFEAARYIDYPIGDALVSLESLGEPGRFTLGIARRSAIARRISAAKSAKLVPLAIDDLAYALRRAHPECDAVIDIGATSTRLIVFADPIPTVVTFPLGGDTFTEAIAQSLGVDEKTAETRKRADGFAGAGETAARSLIDALATSIIDSRAGGYADLRSIVLTGNGSRVPGLAAAIDRAVAIPVTNATLESATTATLPADVLRAAGADWSAAYGLALWEIAL